MSKIRFRASEALAATIGSGAHVADELVRCSQCGQEGPPSTRRPGWCKACGIRASLDAIREGWDNPAPAPAKAAPKAPAHAQPRPAAPLKPRAERAPREPRAQRQPRAVRPAPEPAPPPPPWWQVEIDRLRRLIKYELDEAALEALRKQLIWVYYKSYHERHGGKS